MSEETKREAALTVAYQQFRKYRDGFFANAQVGEVLSQARKFYYGQQYAFDKASGTPKPIFNICREYVERVVAKIIGTKRHVSMLCDSDQDSLQKIDDFYEFQMNEMDDDQTVAEVAKAAFIDGTAVDFTSFDRDTIGTEGLFKGFLKRLVVPFDRTFWSDPYTSDPQDQRYLGFYIDMEVSAAKEMIEGDKKTVAEKSRLVVPENYLDDPNADMTKDMDSDTVRVYVRFFRLDGEVYFECSTMYCDLFESPHALNPDQNEDEIRKRKAAYIKSLTDGDGEQDQDKSVKDYGTDGEKYVEFTKPVKETSGGHRLAKDKFSRYPVQVFSPYPISGCILGQSGVSMLIPNQKIINYTYLLVTLIMQNHAMPKILTKPDALRGQEYDNTPNQILTDYSSISSSAGSGGWGLTRFSSGDAVNSNLIQIGDSFIGLTRKIYGFDDISADSFSSDTSGYAYSQVVKQMNVTLEVPQRRLWHFIKETARTDMMYFKHYIDNAKFFYVRSDAEMALNEDYRNMAQGLINSGKGTLPKETKLKESQKVEIRSVDKKFFDSEFNVTIEVEQGIAGSELTESQHYNQIWQYITQGNVGADKIRVLVTNDPAISRKTRAQFLASLEELETSQLAQKDQEIAQYQAAIKELQAYMQVANQAIDFQKRKQAATEKAAADQTKVAAAMLKEQQPAQQVSEAEAKSLAAKGISGASFSKGGNDTVYNTGQ